MAIVEGRGTLQFKPPADAAENDVSADTTSEKPKKNPAWYKQIDWLSAEVDLGDGGWGKVTIEEPSGSKADEYWDTVRPVAGKDQSEIESKSISAIAVAQLAIYVNGGTDQRIPSGRYDTKAWKTCYEKMPKRVAQRIIDGIELFVGSGESEGN